ncbi:MAG: class I SAM-dependent methyltransferase, partial [Halobacteriota archaeon]
MTDDMTPEQFYDEFASSEWERLQSNPVGRFELENTISALESHLPDGGTMLDAGGGPGRYSVWLAEHGFDVEHLDVSREQVRLARKHAADHGVGDRVSCRKGDIRDLQFDDERFDAVCCLGGPLSHVLDVDARETAVNELARVAALGAPVFVSVIGLLNAIR